MLRSLITFSLNYRLVVLLLAAALLVWGAIAARESPWDVFPEFAPPQIIVQTEAPGLSTEDIERLVTMPVESAAGGVQGLETLRSSSAPGLSVVTAVFEEGTNILTARQLLGERLTQAQAMLPSVAEAPRMEPLKTSLSRLVMIGLTSQTISPQELRSLADWTLQRRLLAVRGVAQVEIYGGEVKQYQVLVTPERLRQYNVTLADVVSAAQNATGFGGAGYVETANQRLPIQQRTRVEGIEDLAAAPVVFREGAPLTLNHVADVKVGAADKAGDALIDGEPGVLLILHRQPHANTLSVMEEVDRAVDELQPTLPAEITVHRNLFRQSTFVERAIGNLNLALVLGSVLVTLVLVAFLFQWRTVVISLAAIPLSLLGAIVTLRWFDLSLNAMTLGGLAIALGAVVDDAIVDVENVLRRLRERGAGSQERGASSKEREARGVFETVLNASLEVRSAIVHASFIVILVLLPVFFLEGIIGTLFRAMGYAYVAAILVSLLVALTVTPAMCFLLLRNVPQRAGDPPVLAGLKLIYAKLLPWNLRWDGWTIAVACALLVASLAAIPWLGAELMPDFRESNLVIFIGGKPDMSLSETRRAGELICKRLGNVDGMESIIQQIGRAELSEDTWGPAMTEAWATLKEGTDYDETIGKLRDVLHNVPGCVTGIKHFLKERMDEVMTGETEGIVIRIFGPDLAELRTQASRVAETVRNIEGVVDLKIDAPVEVPQVEVLLRPAEASRYGFTVGELNREIQMLLEGRTVGQVYEADRMFDVVVRGAAELRSDPSVLGNLLIDAPNGEKLPLRAVANIGMIAGPSEINRDNGSRRILVKCNAVGRDLGSVMNDITRRLASLPEKLPTGYRMDFLGEYQTRQTAERRLVLLSTAALLGIFVLLYLDFRDVPMSLLVMLSVPMACVGGVAAVLLSGGNLSIGSLVGFVTVFGIAVRNGILLVRHYEHLENEEAMPFGHELIMRGASERLAPILMTALSTGLGLLPLVALGDRPGHEIEYPMAVVILGGLVSSTFLSLVLLPVLYQWVAGRRSHTVEGQATS